MVKACSKCGMVKSLDSYHFNKLTKDGRQSHCKVCHKKLARPGHKKYREQPDIREKEARRKRFAKTKFTQELYEAVLIEQGLRCAICKTEFDFAKTKEICADHCHTTERPRGVLCRRCNIAIGLLRDDWEIIQSAALYVEFPPAYWVFENALDLV